METLPWGGGGYGLCGDCDGDLPPSNILAAAPAAGFGLPNGAGLCCIGGPIIGLGACGGGIGAFCGDGDAIIDPLSRFALRRPMVYIALEIKIKKKNLFRTTIFQYFCTKWLLIVLRLRFRL